MYQVPPENSVSPNQPTWAECQPDRNNHLAIWNDHRPYSIIYNPNMVSVLAKKAGTRLNEFKFTCWSFETLETELKYDIFVFIQ